MKSSLVGKNAPYLLVNDNPAVFSFSFSKNSKDGTGSPIGFSSTSLSYKISLRTLSRLELPLIRGERTLNFRR